MTKRQEGTVNFSFSLMFVSSLNDAQVCSHCTPDCKAARPGELKWVQEAGVSATGLTLRQTYPVKEPQGTEHLSFPTVVSCLHHWLGPEDSSH